MKRKRIVIAGMCALLFIYVGSYCVLRLAKYFVRQEFLSEGCSKQIRDRYPDDKGPVRDGYTSYSFASERNQIGCGRIQKNCSKCGENILVPVFRPLGEVEMYVRGFGKVKMEVLKNIAEFERYDSKSNKVYYHRESIMDQFAVSRHDQTF
jgi:hypothetical protein